MSFFDRQGIPETQKERSDDDWDSDEEDSASQLSTDEEELNMT